MEEVACKWDKGIDEYHNTIEENIEKYGLNKDHFKEFKLFKIVDLQKSLCKYCRKGNYCPSHSKFNSMEKIKLTEEEK